jgi:hypothetical protein
MCTGKSCGVVTGAYMVIGLKQNLTPENEQQVKDKIHKLIEDYNKQFIARHGSTACKDLLGMDMGVPGNFDKAKEKGLFDTVCPQLGRDSIEILEKLED